MSLLSRRELDKNIDSTDVHNSWLFVNQWALELQDSLGFVTLAPTEPG